MGVRLDSSLFLTLVFSVLFSVARASPWWGLEREGVKRQKMPALTALAVTHIGALWAGPADRCQSVYRLLPGGSPPIPWHGTFLGQSPTLSGSLHTLSKAIVPPDDLSFVPPDDWAFFPSEGSRAYMWEAHTHLWPLHSLQVQANLSAALFITSGPSSQLAFHLLTVSGRGQLQTPGVQTLAPISITRV